MSFILATRLSVVLCVSAALTTSSCKMFGNIKYNVEVANYGKTGVILLSPPLSGNSFLEEGELEELHVRPGLPTVVADFVPLGQFIGHQNALPRANLILTWQLAELTECKSIIPAEAIAESVKEAGYVPEQHSRKEGCKWAPILGKRYQKVINVKQIRDSKEYKRVGKFVEGNPLNGTYTLNIDLIIREADLQVSLENGTTMGFMQ